MKKLITKTIDLISGDAETKRLEILDYFEKTWEIDEKLYSQLRSDDVFYHRGDPLRHVLLFYLGHTAVFFIGVDEMSWDDLDEKHYNWPTVSEVSAYRDKAKMLLREVILNTSLVLP